MAMASRDVVVVSFFALVMCMRLTLSDFSRSAINHNRRDSESRLFGLSGAFGDGMVLQGGEARAAIYGHCPLSDIVTVTLIETLTNHSSIVRQQTSVQSMSRRRFWKVWIGPFQYGGNFTVVSESAILGVKTTIMNATFGDVWVCASNRGYSGKKSIAHTLKKGPKEDSRSRAAVLKDIAKHERGELLRRVRVLFPNPQPYPLISTFLKTPMLQTETSWRSRYRSRDNDPWSELEERCASSAAAMSVSNRARTIGLVLAIDRMDSLLESWIPSNYQLRCDEAVCAGTSSTAPLSETNLRSCVLRSPFDGDEQGRVAAGNAQLFNGMMSPLREMSVRGLHMDLRNETLVPCMMRVLETSWKEAWSTDVVSAVHGSGRAIEFRMAVSREKIPMGRAQGTRDSDDEGNVSLRRRLRRIFSKLPGKNSLRTD